MAHRGTWPPIRRKEQTYLFLSLCAPLGRWGTGRRASLIGRIGPIHSVGCSARSPEQEPHNQRSQSQKDDRALDPRHSAVPHTSAQPTTRMKYDQQQQGPQLSPTTGSHSRNQSRRPHQQQIHPPEHPPQPLSAENRRHRSRTRASERELLSTERDQSNRRRTDVAK